MDTMETFSRFGARFIATVVELTTKWFRAHHPAV
jgi:hypothetical protein